MDAETLRIFEGDGITHNDFYQKEHSFIYEAIYQLWGKHKTIDVITLSDQLTKN